MLISTRCINGFMSNLIKKSWTDSMLASSIYSGTCCTHYVYCEDSLGLQVWCSSFSLEYLEYFSGTLFCLFISKYFHLIRPRLQLQQAVMDCLFTPSGTQAIKSLQLAKKWLGKFHLFQVVPPPGFDKIHLVNLLTLALLSCYFSHQNRLFDCLLCTANSSTRLQSFLI